MDSRDSKSLSRVVNRALTPSVVLLITGLTYGGAELQVVELAIRLKARGWKPFLVAMTKPEAHLERLSEAGIHVESLDLERGKPNLRAFLKFAALLRAWKPHVLHSHLFHANLLARLEHVFVNVPVVISSFHNNYEQGRLRPKLYRLTDALTHISTNVSQAAVKDYVKAGAVARARLTYIPNGIDTKRFCVNAPARWRVRRELELDEHFVWLSVGRFEKAKDHATMLKAFAQVVTKLPQSKLLLIGQGSLQREIENQAFSLDIAEKLLFLDARSDVEHFLSAADAFVSSSAWEGFGLVLAEALACELPVVATDCGGPSEILEGGKYGSLVPPRSPQALAEAMETLMRLSESERRAVAKAGRAHVEATYSIEHAVDLWEKLYAKLYQKNTGKALI